MRLFPLSFETGAPGRAASRPSGDDPSRTVFRLPAVSFRPAAAGSAKGCRPGARKGQAPGGFGSPRKGGCPPKKLLKQLPNPCACLPAHWRGPSRLHERNRFLREEAMSNDHTKRIAELNDLCRRAMGVAGKLVQTEGINALPAAD